MRFISVCSGIESASVAWDPLGWEALAYSEIEPFPCAVLAHRYPHVPNLGDFTQADWSKYRGAVDLAVAGTPCQDFSVAGLRAGMAGARGNLTLEFLRVLEALRSRWVVWENVPGVLSVDGGRAFGAFLGGLAQLGYGFAYRVLDAQYFGVAQRRRRVFVVGYLGDWRAAAAVLFEREGLCGHPAPRRKAGQGTAADASCCSHWSGGPHPALNQSHNTGGIGMSNQELFSQQGAGLCITGDVAHSLRAEGFDASEDGTGRGQPMVACFGGGNSQPIDVATTRSASGSASGRQDFESETFAVSIALRGREGGGACEMGDDKAHALRCGGGGGGDKPHVLAFDTTQLSSQANRSNPKPGDPCHPLASGAHAPAVAFPANLSATQCAKSEEVSPSMGAKNPTAVAYTLHGADKTVNTATRTDVAGSIRTKPPGSIENSSTTAVCHAIQVRRLTPRECERLQGFPDDYTLIPWRRKPAELCPDGPRYKALGNSKAVPVVRWIGRRIEAVEKILNELPLVAALMAAEGGL